MGKAHTLDLSFTKVTDAGMVHLANACTVDLSYTSVTDAGIVHLRHVHSVKLRHLAFAAKLRDRPV